MALRFAYSNATALNCSGSTPTPQLPSEDEDNSALKWLRFIAFGITFLFGICGNLLVILIVRRPGMRTTSNVLLGNLAVADLTVSLINIPTVLAYSHVKSWPFGPVLCKIVPFVQGVTLSASIGTLLSIACERYWHIVLYVRRKLNVSDAMRWIGVIWCSSVFVPLPLAIFSQTVTVKYGEETLVLCVEIWPSTASRQAYSTLLFLLLYLLPLLAIILLYVLISRFLRAMPVTQRVHNRDSRKVIHMLVAVVLLFAFCWLPYHIVFMYMEYHGPDLSPSFTSFVFFVQWLMFANSVCNPIVYATWNANFKHEFFRMTRRRPERIRRNAVCISIQMVETV